MTSSFESGLEITTNFMMGKSYKLNPLQSLMIVCTSMICGEAQYYRMSTAYQVQPFMEHILFPEFYSEETSEDYFDSIISNALDYDFEGCIQFASKLRNDFYMRLNSNYLLMKAIHHPKRVEFNSKNPLVFKTAIESVGCLPTDWTTQYKLLKEAKLPVPTIWKRAIASKLQNMSAYHAAKYLHGSKTGKQTKDPLYSYSKKNLANLVDLIRITHPRETEVIRQLVKTGKVEVKDEEMTWEKLRSAKNTWSEITMQIRLPHMALLRNLRNIFLDYSTRTDIEETLYEMKILVNQLIEGVRGGKQFPFRYFSAYKMIKSAVVDFGDKKMNALEDGRYANMTKMRELILDGLNRCVLESVEMIPAIQGRVHCLSDNSGSSRGGIVSEYGSVKVYEIANLSALLTAYRATKGGSVWIFGDRLEEYIVSKKPILAQLEELNEIGNNIGGSTETGVWLFWENFIKGGDRLDTVFIYSDMQAGTGGLFVDKSETDNLKQMNAGINDRNVTYIDVLKLVDIYRKTVYPKVNIFSVQVAGYDNSILPDILYRGAILSGWTGKEVILAHQMIELWDQIESISPSPSS